MKLVHGSLFSGFDAPSVAASWMGWKNAFHCEINPFCNEILKYWFPDSEHYEDITKTDFKKWRGRIDILTGGFPCQPFSVAGQRKGADDNRYLWPHMLRAIREIRPAWVIGENVAGILTMVQPGEETKMGSQTSLFGEDNRKRIFLRQEYVVETICKDLEREGYSVQPLLIPACAVGAPHKRDRVWFVAHRNDSSYSDLNRCRNGKNKQEQLTQCKGTPYNCFSGKDGIAPNTNGKRCNNRSDNRKERPFCYDRKRHSKEGQSERNKRKCRACENGTDSSDSNGKRLQGCSNNRKHPKEREKSNDQQSCRLLCTDWEVFPTQSPVCRGNDGLPFDVDNLTIPFIKWRQESIKGYGNAIVPQVILEIFKAIEEVEQLE
ncbi:DNA cytosine methyltransferase [Bacteroides congonensis]